MPFFLCKFAADFGLARTTKAKDHKAFLNTRLVPWHGRKQRVFNLVQFGPSASEDAAGGLRYFEIEIGRCQRDQFLG